MGKTTSVNTGFRSSIDSLAAATLAQVFVIRTLICRAKYGRKIVDILWNCMSARCLPISVDRVDYWSSVYLSITEAIWSDRTAHFGLRIVNQTCQYRVSV